MIEHFFQCPHCWENISMLIDTSQSSYSYIEDCEVCCNPIQIHVKCHNAELTFFNAESIGQ